MHTNIDNAKQVVGWALFALWVFLFAINGGVMLISPRKWFEMPSWLAARGGLRREKYAHGFGAFQIRIFGAMTLGFMGYICFKLLTD